MPVQKTPNGAERLRQIAREANDVKAQQNRTLGNELLNKCEEAASKGEYELRVNTIPPLTQKILQNEGLHVMQRQSGYNETEFLISWR
jgi:hypothetical protein